MARQAQDARERDLRLRGTQRLTNLIRERSGLSAADLEVRFGMAGSSFMPAAPGMRWRRYQRGERAMPAEELDRVARQALVEGWLTATLIFAEDLYAFGSLSGLLSDRSGLAGHDRVAVQIDRIKWKAWHDHRQMSKAREATRLKSLTRKLAVAAAELHALLESLDGTGYDSWGVDLPEQEIEVDALGNIEPVSGEAQYLRMLRELQHVTATIKLNILDGFAADLVPQCSGLCDVEESCDDRASVTSSPQ